jgi:uncharacterized protein (DUF362 family)
MAWQDCHLNRRDFLRIAALGGSAALAAFLEACSNYQRSMIAEINAACTPALVVLDGVEAFISGGPDKGERVSPEVILAGTDRVAIDAAGVALLRYYGCTTEASQGKIFQQEQIARAVELGLGVDSPEKIEFLTGDPESAVYSEKIKEILVSSGA